MSRVARYHADRTNQKLYFARLAYQQAQNNPNRQQAQGEREAAVFHLQGAVLAFLQELARFYRLEISSPTCTSIAQKMSARQQVSPEIQILQQLSQRGFLAELNRAYQACQYAPEPPVPDHGQEAASDLILKVTQSPQAWLPDTQLLAEWHQQLLTLIEGFRNQMVEF